MNVYSAAPHAFKETVRYSPAAHIVVDDSHLHALTCFVYQGIADKAAYGVVFDDIRIEMDVVACLSDGRE